MSFTYDEANIATDPIAQLRLKINDTVEPANFSDEALQYMLDTSQGDVTKAARIALTNLMVSASQQASRTTGQVSETYTGIVDQIRKALKGLEEELARNVNVPQVTATGLFVADMERNDNDTCLYQGIATHRRC